MSNVFQTCLKGFKLKKLVVEPDEEPVDLHLNWSRGAKKLFLSFGTVVQPIKVIPQSVDPHLNLSRSDQGAVEV